MVDLFFYRDPEEAKEHEEEQAEAAFDFQPAAAAPIAEAPWEEGATPAPFEPALAGAGAPGVVGFEAAPAPGVAPAAGWDAAAAPAPGFATAAPPSGFEQVTGMPPF